MVEWPATLGPFQLIIVTQVVITWVVALEPGATPGKSALWLSGGGPCPKLEVPTWELRPSPDGAGTWWVWGSAGGTSGHISERTSPHVGPSGLLGFAVETWGGGARSLGDRDEQFRFRRLQQQLCLCSLQRAGMNLEGAPILSKRSGF